VAAEMLAIGTSYKRSVVAKTIQRMRGDGCMAAPDLNRLDRTR